MALSRLIRECSRCETVESIDREAGIIRGVKLLGEQSENPPPNNHVYPRATREAAIALMEGRRVCIDHPPRTARGETRSYRDNMGLVKDVRESGDGVYGDWHFNPKHELAEQVFWDAQHNPGALGFSINGAGDKRREHGRVIVESITGLDSIDLVSRPATTTGLFESRRKPMQLTVRELIESLKEKRPGYSRSLREQVESGITTDDAMMDMPPEPEPDGDEMPSESTDHEQALADGFKAAITAIVNDDGIDFGEKKRLIMERLAAMEKLQKGKAGKSEPPPVLDDTAEESRRSAVRTDALLELGRKGVRLTPLVEMAVNGCHTADDVKRLVESLATGSQSPRSSMPTNDRQTKKSETVQESRTTEDADAERARRVAEMRRTR